MTDKPIIFSSPMVRALLEGRKTQTRRILKPQPDTTSDPTGRGQWGRCNRYGYWMPASEIQPITPGDRLWVREACRTWADDDFLSPRQIEEIFNDTDMADAGELPDIRWEADLCINQPTSTLFRPGRYRHARHLPRAFSRLTLTVTDVRVQRLHEISNEDCIAEGIEPHGHAFTGYGAQSDVWMAPYDSFASLWNSLHGPEAWGDANPWVAAYTFTVQRGNIDA